MLCNARSQSLAAMLIFTAGLFAQAVNDSQVRPPVTRTDLAIVKRAREILDSPAHWNRADNRRCPEAATTFSLYCALERATTELSGNFEHRGAAMQEARFVIDEMTHNREYDHRLMGYNNDPTTTFADVQKFFELLAQHINLRLEGKEPNARIASPGRSERPPVTQNDIRIIHRAREIIDAPGRWDRADTQKCPADAKAISLFCALKQASIEITGAFDNDNEAMTEARTTITEAIPKGPSYSSRLTDFNNDPATTFAELQKYLVLVEERLTKRMAEERAAH